MGRINNKPYYVFKKICKRCDRVFNPVGKFGRICDDCKIVNQYVKRDGVGRVELSRVEAYKNLGRNNKYVKREKRVDGIIVN